MTKPNTANGKTPEKVQPAASLTGDFVRRTRKLAAHQDLAPASGDAEKKFAASVDLGMPAVSFRSPIKALWPKSKRMQEITIVTGSFCLATTLYSVVVAMA